MARAVATLFMLCLASSACVRRVETRTVTVTGEELRREDLMRAGENLPARFSVVTRPATPRDCPPSLRDDALATTLTLRRSLLIPVQGASGTNYQTFGDYAVEPAGKYGEKPGEGVRVDCTLVRGVGIVILRSGEGATAGE